PRGFHQPQHVIDQRITHPYLGHRLLDRQQAGVIEQGFQARQQRAARIAEQQRPFRRLRRIAQGQAHQETVELRFRQGEGAAGTDRVLRGDHEEGFGQGPRGAFDGHLALLHRLEQRALAFWGGTIDLVGQHQLGEDRPRVEHELAAVLVEHRGPEDVARQQIGGELDALELEPQYLRQGVAERGLAHAGQVFDQQMPTRQQAGQRQPHLWLLAEHDLVDAGQTGLELRTHETPLPQSVRRSYWRAGGTPSNGNLY